MRIVIAAVGRKRRSPEAELVGRFLKRINAAGPAIGIRSAELREFDEAKHSDAAQRRKAEAETLLSRIGGFDRAIALDEGGRGLTSEAFAKKIAEWRDRGTDRCAFLIGGPDGHGEPVRARADMMLSLSAMTLPHLLARAILCEQLYRAVTILSGHPYHR